MRERAADAFVKTRDLQQPALAESAADELYAGWQAIPSEAARHGDRREPREIRRAACAYQGGADLASPDRRRRYGRGRSDQRVHLGERLRKSGARTRDDRERLAILGVAHPATLFEPVAHIRAIFRCAPGKISHLLVV